MTQVDSGTHRKMVLDLAKQRGCTPREAASLIRAERNKPEAQRKQAVEVAAHVDWGHRTDIAYEIRAMAETIERHGERSVTNKDRNRILRGLPRSLSVNQP